MLILATVLDRLSARPWALVLFALGAPAPALTVRGAPAPGGTRPPVSIVVPAYNEEMGIAADRDLLAGIATTTAAFEVIVVDDGSTDATAAIVRGLGLPRRPAGQASATRAKPAALNHGHRRGTARHSGAGGRRYGVPARHPGHAGRHGCGISARSGAVSGNTKVGNRNGILGRWQHLEYVMGVQTWTGRMYDMIRAMPTVPGAIGAFRRPGAGDGRWALSGETLAEDTDLTMAVCRRGWTRHLRGIRDRLDRGSRQPSPALAAALPVVLRDHAVHVGSTGRAVIERRAASGRFGPPLPDLPGAVSTLLLPPVRAHRRRRPWSTACCFLNPGAGPIEFWLGFALPAGADLRVMPCGWDGERLTPAVGRCRSSSWSTGNCCTWSTVQSLITAPARQPTSAGQPIRRGGCLRRPAARANDEVRDPVPAVTAGQPHMGARPWGALDPGGPSGASGSVLERDPASAREDSHMAAVPADTMILGALTRGGSGPRGPGRPRMSRHQTT